VQGGALRQLKKKEEVGRENIPPAVVWRVTEYRSEKPIPNV
jgi:hypothetical protein